MHFTNCEVGLYIRLLCVQWSSGSLPDNDAELASYGKGVTSLSRIKLKFKKGADGRLRNRRLEEVRKKQTEFRKHASQSGAAGAAKRWGGHSNPTNSPLGFDSSPSPTLSPTPKGGGKEPPLNGQLTASDKISYEKSIERISKRLVEIKDADLPGFPEERRNLKAEKIRLLGLLGLKA